MRHVIGAEIDSIRPLSEMERHDLLKSFEYYLRTVYGLGASIVLLSKINSQDTGQPVK